MNNLPSQYSYNMDDESVASRMYRTTFESEEDVYNTGDRITINIPDGHNSLLNCSNSWLDISLSATNVVMSGTPVI